MFVFDTKQTLTHGGVFLVFDDDMSLPLLSNDDNNVMSSSNII